MAADVAVAPARLVGREPRSRPLLRRLARSYAGAVGGTLLAVAVVAALAAPLLAPQSYDEQDLANPLQPPAWVDGGTWSHPLGSDQLGRDIASRLIWAARVSLGIAGIATLVAMVVGVVVGLITGYYGGVADAILMRIADVQLAFPYLVLAIAVMALLGPSLTNLILLLALPGWMVYVRSSVLSLKHCEFVEAAVASGASHRRVIVHHLLPNIVPPVVVISSFQLAHVIIAESSLSFLGVGIPPPRPSWGSMLSQGREYFTTAWWLGVFPGLAITIAVLGISLIGDGLRDALDPRVKL